MIEVTFAVTSFNINGTFMVFCVGVKLNMGSGFSVTSYKYFFICKLLKVSLFSGISFLND